MIYLIAGKIQFIPEKSFTVVDCKFHRRHFRNE